MATVADPATKPRAKSPGRPRKAASGTSAAIAPAKPAARKAAAPRTATEKVSARIATARKSAAGTASNAVDAIKAVADKAIEASHVGDAAKAVASRARKATARKSVAGKSAPKPRAAPRKSSPGVGAGTMLGVAAAGLAAGIAVNLGRKAAVQAPSVMAGDWFEALKAEHKAALALLDKLARSTPEQSARRTLMLTQLKHALGKHAFTEENVIYPALREWGDKADADALNQEQGYHKQFLYELDGMDKAAAGFAQKVADFRADLAAHIAEEEDKIYPKLHAGLSADKNKALTGMANKEGFKLA